MTKESRSQPKIDELSRVIGSLEAQFLNVERSMVSLTNTVHANNELATASRGEIKKEIAAVNEKLNPTVDAVAIMKPIMDDYTNNKNRAIGFVIALSLVMGILGATIKTAIDMYWKKP